MVYRTGIVDHIDLRVRRTDWSIARRIFGSKIRPQVTPALAGRPHDSWMGIMCVAVGEREYDIDNNFVEANYVLTTSRI